MAAAVTGAIVAAPSTMQLVGANEDFRDRITAAITSIKFPATGEEDPRLQKSTFSLSGRAISHLIASYCTTPEEEVEQAFPAQFIQNIGLQRLVNIPQVSSEDLDVQKNLEWVADERFPSVDVARLSAMAVRGQSTKKETALDPTEVAFIAIRYISNKSPTKNVEFIHLDSNGIAFGQILFPGRFSVEDDSRLQRLLDGAPIGWRTKCHENTISPDERFTMI